MQKNKKLESLTDRFRRRLKDRRRRRRNNVVDSKEEEDEDTELKFRWNRISRQRKYISGREVRSEIENMKTGTYLKTRSEASGFRTKKNMMPKARP